MLAALAELDGLRRALPSRRRQARSGLLDDSPPGTRELLAAPDEYEQLRLLTAGTPRGSVSQGRKDNWPAECPVDSVRARVKAVRELVADTTARLAEVVVRRLAWELAQFTLREAAAPATRGELEFHDLLVLARAVLRDPEHGWDVRRACAPATRGCCSTSSRTPIRSSATSPRCSRRANPTPAHQRWDELPVDPGRLFVVGDPKQSIYRFRRADIAAFLRARSAFGAAPRRLTRNFRTARPVIDFVNAVFRELIVAEPESQPEYVALEPVRDAVPVGPAGRAPRRRARAGEADADELRELEAADVAAVVGPRARARSGRCHAREPPTATEQFAPCRLGDICILLPARTSLGHLEDALDAAGIPYRAETSSLVYGTREIRDLLMVLQAVDDPTDELALVSALRSPVFGCGDDDLFTFKVQHGGRWDHQRPLPDTLPARPPGRRRASVRSRRGTTPGSGCRPASCSTASCANARVLEVGFAHGRPARPVAARALRHRAGPRVRRSRGRQPARLPRLGRARRAAKVRGSSRRCCPRPTTTRCGSSPSTAPRASSSRSRSCRA